jgi:hypothetical protein
MYQLFGDKMLFKVFILGLISIGIIATEGCSEFPPSENDEKQDIQFNINNENDIDIKLPDDNSTYDLNNSSDSDSDSNSSSSSSSSSDNNSTESNSASDNSSSSSKRVGYRISNINNITVYEFNSF